MKKYVLVGEGISQFIFVLFEQATIRIYAYLNSYDECFPWSGIFNPKGGQAMLEKFILW